MRSPRLWLVVGVAAASVVVMPEKALACSCAPAPPPQEAVDDFDAVFAGTVERAEDRSRPPKSRKGKPVGVSSFGPILYTFKVDAAARGDVISTMQVLSTGGGASCGASFREGKRYLVFAYFGHDLRDTGDPRDPLWTNLCTPTQSVGLNTPLPIAATPVAERELVGPPLDPAGERSPWVFIGGATVIVVAAAVLVLRLRRSPSR
ncbi:MAG TPA: hypothetical protein VM573_01245 [Actinomycetota bacterium]|jgi:hypothetical protein|nr:hypothetical protein [Actinomycetota bacterium]